MTGRSPAGKRIEGFNLFFGEEIAHGNQTPWGITNVFFIHGEYSCLILSFASSVNTVIKTASFKNEKISELKSVCKSTFMSVPPIVTI
ncbi:hypothetical protein [Bacillus sp. FJAT-27225]|uniref:hypothetical protein n=1 Tax=Bacillus sp. FJAT-27225 TaxID=1743144 RepID=UPI000981623D